MSYVDIGIIVIFVLSALVGLWNGMGKALIKLICFVSALVVCFLVSDYCLKFLLGVEVIRNLALGESWSLRSLIGTAINADATGVVEMLYKPLIERYAQIGGVAAWNVGVEEYLSVAVSLHLFTVVLSVILYIAARIVASILGYILKLIFIHDFPKTLSRLAGMVIGAAKGALICAVLLLVCSVVLPFGIGGVVAEQIESSDIAVVICQTEYKIAAEQLYSDETLCLMMEGAGYTRTELPEQIPAQ